MNYILRLPSNFRGTYPIAGRVFIAGSAICLFLSGYSWLQAGSAQRELEWRKQQLILPIYKLSEEEHINPPWNNDNIHEWLYRRGIFCTYVQLKLVVDPSTGISVLYPMLLTVLMGSSVLCLCWSSKTRTDPMPKG
jgi:hypothetical protein